MANPAEDAEIQIAGKSHIVPLRRSVYSPLPEQGTDEVYHLSLWFRTSEGYVEQLQLYTFGPLREGKDTSQAPSFQVAERIQELNKGEGFLVLGIAPNVKGVLAESFLVQIWVPLDQLERRNFKMGRTLMIGGSYRPIRRLKPQ